MSVGLKEWIIRAFPPRNQHCIPPSPSTRVRPQDQTFLDQTASPNNNFQVLVESFTGTLWPTFRTVVWIKCGVSNPLSEEFLSVVILMITWGVCGRVCVFTPSYYPVSVLLYGSASVATVKGTSKSTVHAVNIYHCFLLLFFQNHLTGLNIIK